MGAVTGAQDDRPDDGARPYAPGAADRPGAGREIQGPMALVILGGLVTSTVMSLLLLPALIWRYWRPRQS